MTSVKRFGAEVADEERRPSTIALGIGGAGRNIISDIEAKSLSNIRMYEVGTSERVPDISFINISKDDMRDAYESDLSFNKRPLTKSEKKIKRRIREADLFYLVAGLGGETGSWSTPPCAALSSSYGAFTVGLFAKPFESENIERRKFADRTQKKLQKDMDIAAVFPNSKLLDINPHLPMKKAFGVINTIMRLPMEDLNGVITKDDISDLKKFCRDVEEFRIGAGYGKGRERGKRASKEALRSPWLEDFDDYKTVLAVVTSGEGGGEIEAEDAMEVIQNEWPDVNMMWGLRKDTSIEDRTRVTILAGV
ncbi:MAG: hypothetical protein KGY76_02390 [Candidatus Thermoplasmatota archaeon]|nr:hypothetical protein [Candidatus Thermoplasmatota archaeon]